jgi:hypothetical protein
MRIAGARRIESLGPAVGSSRRVASQITCAQKRILRDPLRHHFLRQGSFPGNVSRRGNGTAVVHLRMVSMPCGPD